MDEVRIKDTITVRTTGEETAEILLAGLFLLIATIPLWGLPALVSIWLGIFLHSQWHWHPVFAIAATIAAFGIPVFLVIALLRLIGRRPAMFVVGAWYAVAGWAFAGNVMQVDAIWSVVVTAAFAALGALFGRQLVKRH
jgi:hypothetical protein